MQALLAQRSMPEVCGCSQAVGAQSRFPHFSRRSARQLLLEFLEAFGPRDTFDRATDAEVVEAALSALERLSAQPAVRATIVGHDGPNALVVAASNHHDEPCYRRALALAVALARGSSPAQRAAEVCYCAWR